MKYGKLTHHAVTHAGLLHKNWKREGNQGRESFFVPCVHKGRREMNRSHVSEPVCLVHYVAHFRPSISWHIRECPCTPSHAQVGLIQRIRSLAAFRSSGSCSLNTRAQLPIPKPSSQLQLRSTWRPRALMSLVTLSSMDLASQSLNNLRLPLRSLQPVVKVIDSLIRVFRR